MLSHSAGLVRDGAAQGGDDRFIVGLQLFQHPLPVLFGIAVLDAGKISEGRITLRRKLAQSANALGDQIDLDEDARPRRSGDDRIERMGDFIFGGVADAHGGPDSAVTHIDDGGRLVVFADAGHFIAEVAQDGGLAIRIFQAGGQPQSGTDISGGGGLEP